MLVSGKKKERWKYLDYRIHTLLYRMGYGMGYHMLVTSFACFLEIHFKSIALYFLSMITSLERPGNSSRLKFNLRASKVQGSRFIYFTLFTLRTFARNFSNIDFFLKILPVKVDELVMSEMWKNWGVTDFVLERTCPEVHPNLRKSGFVSEEDHSGLKSQNIAIRALKWSVLCQIWFKWA